VDRFGSRRFAARARVGARSVAIGLLGGGALIGLAVFARALGGSPLGPSMGALAGGGLFPGWAIATIVVAGGEEALLRGALFDRIASIAGPWWAIGVTSLAFALMHVPFYGWHVVPLDLGVGIWLAGLRLETGGVLAPWLAHALADLATWWL
jgi:membrane protease YdiL (CAAX protease family)